MDKMVMRVQKNKKKKAVDEQKQAGGKMKKKGVKVVYISNPMKVKTSASEFRALVQELTGRDSDIMSLLHPSKFSKDNVQICVGGSHQKQQQEQEQEQEAEVSILPNYDIMNKINSPTTINSSNTNTRSEMSYDESDLSFETFDDHDDAMLIMSDQILPNNFFQSAAGASYMV